MNTEKERKLALIREAGEWLDRLKSPDATTHIAFENWLAADPEHAKIVQRVQTLGSALRIGWKHQPQIRNLESGSEVVPLRPMLGPMPATPLEPQEAISRPIDERAAGRVRLRHVFGALAACVILGVIPILVSDEPLSIYQAGEAPMRVNLRDGSVVHLNAHARMTVRLSRRARELTLLRGEAQFKVAQEPSRPFRVTALGLIAQALGTRFDVRIDPGQRVSVFVEEGKVWVRDGHDATASPGPVVHALEMARIEMKPDGAPLEVRELTPQELELALAWLVRSPIRSTTLKEAAAQVSARTGTRIVFDDREAGDLQLGGPFDADDAATFTQALRHFRGLSVTGPDAGGALHVSSRPKHTKVRPAPTQPRAP